MVDRLDEQLQELVARVAGRTSAPAPTAIRRRARRRRQCRAGGIALLVVALVATLVTVDRAFPRRASEVVPARPSPAASTASATTQPGPVVQVPNPAGTSLPGPTAQGPLHGKVLLSGRENGVPWRLVVRSGKGQDCYDFQAGRDIELSTGDKQCQGPGQQLTYGGAGSPSDSSPFAYDVGFVTPNAAHLRLTYKRWPKDQRTRPVRVETVPALAAGAGFHHKLFLAIHPKDLWVAELLLLDDRGRRICRALGDDFKTQYLDTSCH
jgi:hypothetical protein